MSQQHWVGIENSRKSLYLAVGIALAAPHIVVHHTGTSHYIHDLQRSIDTSCHTGTHHTIGCKLPKQFSSPYGSINLPDSTTSQHSFIVSQPAKHILPSTFVYFLFSVQASDQPIVLALHGTDNSYLHISQFCYSVSDMLRAQKYYILP